jgi:hypothetical protein
MVMESVLVNLVLEDAVHQASDEIGLDAKGEALHIGASPQD